MRENYELRRAFDAALTAAIHYGTEQMNALQGENAWLRGRLKELRAPARHCPQSPRVHH